MAAGRREPETGSLDASTSFGYSLPTIVEETIAPMTTDPFESILRPLADEFAKKVAAAISQHLRERVATEVQAVVERAFGGALEHAAAAVVPAVRATKVARLAAVTKSAAIPTNTCSKPGCGQSFYRPSGRNKQLCYVHFRAAGGKAPDGRKTGVGKKPKKTKKSKRR